MIGPILIALLLIVAAGSIFLIRKYTPTKEHMPAEEYFGVLAEDEVAVILQDELLERRGILRDGALYLDYQTVRESLNSRFFWDEEGEQMLFTTALETYEIPVGSNEYTIDGILTSYEQKILCQEADGLYLSADFLSQFTDMDYVLSSEPSRVRICTDWGSRLTASVTKDAPVRCLGGIKSPILTDMKKDREVTVLEELETWAKVVTDDGYIGYMKKSHLSAITETEVTHEFVPQEYSSLTREEPVRLAWHMIYADEANEYLEDTISQMKGINVISPTWYSVEDNQGTISSLASEEYVRIAHEAGLEVWALVSNFSPDMDTTTLLSSTKARRKMIDTLVTDALRLGIEGINLDFEYIREECGLSYVQFVRELSIACRKNGLVLSLDLPVPMDFNRYFNRRELGCVADYLIIMGYDEHYSGSEPGSVASLSFEENGITGTLAQDVPARKILSGIPFYTRIWYTATGEDGSPVVNSEEISMSVVDNTLEYYDLNPTWDDSTGQNYVAWNTDEGVLCQIWMEDVRSLKEKISLVDQYDLGGLAIWALGFEKPEVWDLLE